jgi:hypothetical protein
VAARDATSSWGDHAKPYDELFGAAGYDYCGHGSIRVDWETDDDYVAGVGGQGS